MVPIMSPAVGYVLALYRILTEDELVKTSPQIEEMESLEDGKCSLTTSDEDPMDTTTQELSNKDLFVKFLTNSWHKLVKFIFQFEYDATLGRKESLRVLPSSLQDKIKWLDEEQKQFIRAVLDREKIIACMAPPGTGKTTLIAMCAVLLHMANSNEKILCIAQTNAAANVLAERIMFYLLKFQGGIEPQTLLRVVRPGYSSTELGSLYKYSSEALPADASATYLRSHKIIVQTVDLAIMNSVNSKHNTDSEPSYNLVIIDEAASVDLPRMALLMILGIDSQIVLLGDIEQLPAYITSEKLKAVAADESGMEFVVRLIKANGVGRVIDLQHNYRSLEIIVQPVNRVIYSENQLIAARNPRLQGEIDIANELTEGQLKRLLLPGTPNGGISAHRRNNEETWT